MLGVLAVNSFFLGRPPAVGARRRLPLVGVTALQGPDGPLGLEIETFAVPGKVALYLENKDAEGFGTAPGDTIGVAIRPTGTADKIRTAHYVPGCAAVDGALRARLDGSGCLLFDGTVFTDDEMRTTGVGEKSGARMGHLAISGPDGSLAALSGISARRRIYIHINNTNPILAPGSEAERTVRAAGWEIGVDGLELTI